MGRSFIKAILNSARNIQPKDNSPDAQNKRRISGFRDLDGIEFLAKIEVGKDARGDDKNEIRVAVTPDSKDYTAPSAPQSYGYQPPAAAPSQAPANPNAPHNPNKPSWAQ